MRTEIKIYTRTIDSAKRYIHNLEKIYGRLNVLRTSKCVFVVDAENASRGWTIVVCGNTIGVNSHYGDTFRHVRDIKPLFDMTLDANAVNKNIDSAGKEAIVRMMYEELGEFIQAMSKVERDDIKNNTDSYDIAMCNLKEEMADVLIMMHQLQKVYAIPTDDIQDVIDYKIVRQLERIVDERNKG